jgi:hypothetical protein
LFTKHGPYIFFSQSKGLELLRLHCRSVLGFVVSMYKVLLIVRLMIFIHTLCKTHAYKIDLSHMYESHTQYECLYKLITHL